MSFSYEIELITSLKYLSNINYNMILQEQIKKSWKIYKNIAKMTTIRTKKITRYDKITQCMLAFRTQ